MIVSEHFLSECEGVNGPLGKRERLAYGRESRRACHGVGDGPCYLSILGEQRAGLCRVTALKQCDSQKRP